MEDPTAAERETVAPAHPLPTGAGPDDFALDAELIKVLASDSRRDILRHLQKRRMTLTELAAALDLKKATVLEHLKRLTDANLVRRLDENRLWVYYELSPRGKRVVNPGRTRFYLLMGVAAAAMVLAGATLGAAYLYTMDEPEPRASSAPLSVGVTDATSGGEGVLALDLYMDDTASEPRAYLLTADERDALARDDRVVAGIPLSLAEAEGGVARFRAFSPVPAGTYFVYVVDEDGRDNFDQLASVVVPAYNLTAPSVLWKGVDEGGAFRLLRDGQPANGTLLLVAGEGHELPTLPLSDGEAFLDAATLDRLVPARYAVQYLPVGERWWITLDATVDVRALLAVPDPAVIVEGWNTTVDVHVAPSWLQPPTRIAFTLAGEPVEATRRDEVHTLALDEPAAGPLALAAGRDEARAIEVRPDVRYSFLVEAEGLRALLAKPDGSPLVGALLQIDDEDVGTTDENGSLRLEALPASGTHKVTTIADGESVLISSRAMHFEGYNVTATEPDLAIADVRAQANLTGASVRVRIESGSVAPETATLLVHVDGSVVASSVVDVPALGAIEREIRMPLRLAPGDHAVSASLRALHRWPIDFLNFTALASDPASPYSSYKPSEADAASNATVGLVLYRAENASVRVEENEPMRIEHRAPEPALAPGAPDAEGSMTQGDAAPAASVPGPGLALVVAAIALVAWSARRR